MKKYIITTITSVCLMATMVLAEEVGNVPHSQPAASEHGQEKFSSVNEEIQYEWLEKEMAKLKQLEPLIIISLHRSFEIGAKHYTIAELAANYPVCERGSKGEAWMDFYRNPEIVEAYRKFKDNNTRAPGIRLLEKVARTYSFTTQFTDNDCYPNNEDVLSVDELIDEAKRILNSEEFGKAMELLTEIEAVRQEPELFEGFGEELVEAYQSEEVEQIINDFVTRHPEVRYGAIGDLQRAFKRAEAIVKRLVPPELRRTFIVSRENKENTMGKPSENTMSRSSSIAQKMVAVAFWGSLINTSLQIYYRNPSWPYSLSLSLIATLLYADELGHFIENQLNG